MQAFNLYTIHKRLSVGQAQTGEYKANQRAQTTQHQNSFQPNKEHEELTQFIAFDLKRF